MNNIDYLKYVSNLGMTNWSSVIKRNWKRTIAAITIAIITVLCIAGIRAVILIGYKTPWTGFAEFTKPSDKYERAKTLWDWLSLLVVPVLIGLVGVIVAYLLNSRQKERELTSQTNRFREEALQKYFDHMTQLMLREGASTLISTAHVQNIARYRTLTVLRELDGERRATLLRFLYESQLIAKGQRIVDLDAADLSETNLSGIKLRDANLDNVNLSGANLSKADLSGASLYRADLSGANLKGAMLDQADLGGAILSKADLTGAEKFTDDQLLKAGEWGGIKPTDLERSLSRRGESPPRTDDLRSWLSTTQWLKRTDRISHKTTLEYEDENETHGPWLVSRGRHKVGPLKDYYMGIFLVTNELFSRFVQDKGYESGDGFWEGVPSQSKATFLCQDGKTSGPSTWPTKAGFPEGRAHHPVAGISYYEALAFCRWLQKRNPPEDGCQWCLPTENMWELVARPEKGFLYPWGPKFEPDRCNSVEAKVGLTTEVGRFQNGKKTRCFDMAGNVWEFVREDEDEHWYCVLRGGSYRNNEHQVKSSLRLWGVPRDHRPPDFGFRCALVHNRA